MGSNELKYATLPSGQKVQIKWTDAFLRSNRLCKGCLFFDEQCQCKKGERKRTHAGSSRDTAPGASWAAKLAKFGGAPGKRAF